MEIDLCRKFINKNVEWEEIGREYFLVVFFSFLVGAYLRKRKLM